ncbi:MAG: FMN-binding protein [Methylococcales bacterium]|nr:FMN-binding protein [Methylococcales bacterium]
MSKKIILLLLACWCYGVQAETYQSQGDFLIHAFSDTKVPDPKILWIDKTIKPSVQKILQHKAGFLRTRYWQNGVRSVWILDEIGKIKLITVAVIIEQQKIVQLKVLAFRESRGWEVKHDFFTQQFKQLFLGDELRLSTPIDGISGATLSVRALTKIAQLALLFDKKIHERP